MVIYKIFLLFFVTVLFALEIPAQNYRGGEYRTKESFLYGRFEASIKAAGKEGTLTTMFTYFDGLPDDPWSSSKWNEIDIEILGRYNNDVQFNTITPGQVNHVRHQYVNFDPAVDFHTYAFEWTPDYVAWFIDGAEVYRQTGDFIKTLTRVQKFMFNIWIPTYENWVGVFDEQLIPTFGYYDWAAYYKYTPGSGNYGTNNNFTLDWRDEFDSFDTARWEKATHTFGGNRVTFDPANIVFANGKMILCLTDKTNMGYTDTKVPIVLTARTYSDKKILAFFSDQVDRTTAENPSNYELTAGNITSAKLWGDNRTVELTADQLDYNALPNLIVKAGIKELNFPANQTALHLRQIIKTHQFTFPLYIEVGGQAFSNYIADAEFKTATYDYGYMEGNMASTANAIANTEDDAVFQTEVNGLAKYVVRVPNGQYLVRLLFSENYFTTPGKRVFDIYVQGKLVINDLDIYKEAGHNKALTKIVNQVEVANGLLDIHFAAEVERPILNGLIINSIFTNVEEENELGFQYKLFQNYPNPFNGNTVIKFSLSKPEEITFRVFDLLGREIFKEKLGFLNKGNNQLVWNAQMSNGAKLTSGVYFYLIEGIDRSEVKKLLLLN